MGLHSVNWSVHCSAVDDIEIIEESLSLLSDNCGELRKEKTKSYHGSPHTTITLKIDKKREAKKSFEKLGEDILLNIQRNGIYKLIDENKVLHIRLSISHLVQGILQLAEGDERKIAVKGRFKIESYPGQKPENIVSDLIEEIISNDLG
tara:strand:- start:37507 stop:37953 length:447 start_codon:yes stop_codon:yes gene_type:complete